MRYHLHRDCPIIRLKELRKKLFILAGILAEMKPYTIPCKCKPDFWVFLMEVLLFKSALNSLVFLVFFYDHCM